MLRAPSCQLFSTSGTRLITEPRPPCFDEANGYSSHDHGLLALMAGHPDANLLLCVEKYSGGETLTIFLTLFKFKILYCIVLYWTYPYFGSLYSGLRFSAYGICSTQCIALHGTALFCFISSYLSILPYPILVCANLPFPTQHYSTVSCRTLLYCILTYHAIPHPTPSCPTPP